MSLLYAYRNRAIAHNVTILDVNNQVIWPQANDVVRLRITVGTQEFLSVSSAAPTANGSFINKGAPCLVSLAAADLNLAGGIYDYDMDYGDGTDNQWKEIEKGILCIEDSHSLVTTSDALLELGLSNSCTDEERAIVNAQIIRAYAAIKKHLRYDPVWGVRTELYPRYNFNKHTTAYTLEVFATEAGFRIALENN
jgi:hypothetical protein